MTRWFRIVWVPRVWTGGLCTEGEGRGFVGLERRVVFLPSVSSAPLWRIVPIFSLFSICGDRTQRSLIEEKRG